MNTSRPDTASSISHSFNTNSRRKHKIEQIFLLLRWFEWIVKVELVLLLCPPEGRSIELLPSLIFSIHSKESAQLAASAGGLQQRQTVGACSSVQWDAKLGVWRRIPFAASIMNRDQFTRNVSRSSGSVRFYTRGLYNLGRFHFIRPIKTLQEN